MVFAVAGGGQLDTGSYQIDNSVRFNDNDSAYLTRTPSSAGTRTKWTWSAWIKRGNLNDATSYQQLWSAGTGQQNRDVLFFDADTDDTLAIYTTTGGAGSLLFRTASLYRDTSAWYHIVIKWDTTQATASNRVKFYVNGVAQTFTTANYPGQNSNSAWWNTSNAHYMGTHPSLNEFFDGYMSEVNFVDGQGLDADSFGEFDTDSGIWKPIAYTGSYGTNGFYLDFGNSASLGADQSGNGNNWGLNNIDSIDQMQDTPTNNFCVMNYLHRRGSVTSSQANLRISLGSSSAIAGTHSINSGKWYYEAKMQSGSETMVGWINPDISRFYTGNTFEQAGNVLYYSGNGGLYKYGGSAAYGASYGGGTIIGCALDLDNNQVTFYKNGTSQGTASINAGNYVPYLITGGNSADWSFCFNSYDFSVASGNSDANGYGNFEYAPPSGYLAWCTQNFAEVEPTTIDNSQDYFKPVIYTGNSTENRAVSVGFQPDFVWIKRRSDNAANHSLFDSSRGATNKLSSNSTGSESSLAANGTLNSFTSTGFTLGGAGGSYPFWETNYSSAPYVAWSWKINGGTTSTNTNGTITTTVQANQDAGISILTYTGNGSNATIGHGLSKAPEVMIGKIRNEDYYGWGGNWWTYRNTGQFQLNSSNPYYENSVYWQNTNPSSTVITMGGQVECNRGGSFTQVAYCFHSVEGFSKMGTYYGNNSSDGAFIHTGFKPAFIMTKNSSLSGGGGNWEIYDNARNTYNALDVVLIPNSSNGDESVPGRLDFCSNGFKWRSSGGSVNGTYDIMFMAFAENPFYTSSGVSGTAR